MYALLLKVQKTEHVNDICFSNEQNVMLGKVVFFYFYLIFL